MIKAIIFDMDGLMIDSEPLVSKSIEILIRQYGKNPILQKTGLIHEVGLGKEMWKIIKKRHQINEKVNILRAKRRAIFTSLLKKQKVKPMPGLLKLLPSLKKEGVKMGLASNTALTYIKIHLNNLRVNKYFNIIVSGDDVKEHKPSPDIYIEVARRLNIPARSCVVLEDSEVGVIAAINAGMKTIAIPNRYTNHHNFSKATLTVPSLRHITWKLLLSI